MISNEMIKIVKVVSDFEFTKLLLIIIIRYAS